MQLSCPSSHWLKYNLHVLVTHVKFTYYSFHEYLRYEYFKQRTRPKRNKTTQTDGFISGGAGGDGEYVLEEEPASVPEIALKVAFYYIKMSPF